MSGGKGQMLLLIPFLGTVGMEYIKPEYFQFKRQHGIVPVWESLIMSQLLCSFG